MVYNVSLGPIEVFFDFLLSEYEPLWTTPLVAFLITSKDKMGYVKNNFLTRCYIHRTAHLYFGSI